MVKPSPQTMLYAAGAVGAFAALWYAKEKMLPALNPFSPENLASQGAETLYKTVTGSKGSLGADAWHFLHAPDSVLRYVDPTSNRNVVARGVDSAWRAVGVLDEYETVGSKAYDGVQWIKSFF